MTVIEHYTGKIIKKYVVLIIRIKIRIRIFYCQFWVHKGKTR